MVEERCSELLLIPDVGLQHHLADGNAVSPAQATTLVGVPVYPNAIKWSEENLLAAAAGHLATILNPANLAGPRGFIPITPSRLFDVGRVHKADLHAKPLLPFRLAREARVGVRCVDWSPQGLATNGGCLLAICTTDFRVKLYRAPFCDFQSEWVEVQDLSEMMYTYCLDNNFMASTAHVDMEDESLELPLICPGMKRKCCEYEDARQLKVRKKSNNSGGKKGRDKLVGPTLQTSTVTILREPSVQNSDMQAVNLSQIRATLGLSLSQGSPVEVLKEDSGQRYWISGSVLELGDDGALVRFHQPGAEMMEEWVPLPNCSITLQKPKIRPLYPIGSSNVERTTNDDEVVARSFAAGDSVEALVNNRWQEGEVVDFDCGVIVKLTSGLVHTVKEFGNLRLAPLWQDEQWVWQRYGTLFNCTNGIGPPQDKKDGQVLRLMEGGLVETLAHDSRKHSVCEQVGIKDKKSLLQNTLKMFGKRKDQRSHQKASGVCCGNNANQGLMQVVLDTSATRSKRNRRPPKEFNTINWVTDVRPNSTPVLIDVAEADVEIASLVLPKPNFPAGNLKSQVTAKDENYITPAQYAARSDMLAPLVLGWSPRFCAPYLAGSKYPCRAQKFTLLAAGMKSGKVGIWRMAYPDTFSVEGPSVSSDTCFVGFLFTHESWVTSLSWSSCSSSNDVDETLFLATGCADGSIKLWHGNARELAAPSCSLLPFGLLTQVMNADSIIVSSLALVVPSQPGHRVLLAVGKGSGTVAAWEMNLSGFVSQTAVQLCGHEQIVTGVSWTLNGRCIYTCGQDNSLKCWEFLCNKLWPLPFPDSSTLVANSPNSNILNDLPALEALESFFGVALSANCLALAVVRGIAADMTDQMYQLRSQKGVVQIFWIGGQELTKDQVLITDGLENSSVSLSTIGITFWESRIVSGLEHMENSKYPLVLWDIIAALSFLKQVLGVSIIGSVLSKWLRSWELESHSLSVTDTCSWSVEHFRRYIPKASSRKLQILNVISRQLLLCRLKGEVLSRQTYSEVDEVNPELLHREKLWRDQIWQVEHELRQRSIFLILLALSRGVNFAHILEGENTLGLFLMVTWVQSNLSAVFPQLVEAVSQLYNSNNNLLAGIGKSRPSETCTFCDAPVLLESPEFASCTGSKTTSSKHSLERCSVSLRLCPSVGHWFCGCCARYASQPPMALLFFLSSRSELERLTLALLAQAETFPSCPFCGILMHRMLPEFLLSPSLI